MFFFFRFFFFSYYPLGPGWNGFWRHLDAGKCSIAGVLRFGEYKSLFANIAPVLTQHSLVDNFFYSSFQRNPYLAFPYLVWNIFMLLYTFGLTIFFVAIWNGVSRSAVPELQQQQVALFA